MCVVAYNCLHFDYNYDKQPGDTKMLCQLYVKCMSTVILRKENRMNVGPILNGDRDLLTIVFDNLLGNPAAYNSYTFSSKIAYPCLVMAPTTNRPVPGIYTRLQNVLAEFLI